MIILLAYFIYIFKIYLYLLSYTQSYILKIDLMKQNIFVQFVQNMSCNVNNISVKIISNIKI